MVLVELCIQIGPDNFGFPPMMSFTDLRGSPVYPRPLQKQDDGYRSEWSYRNAISAQVVVSRIVAGEEGTWSWGCPFSKSRLHRFRVHPFHR